MKKVINKTNKYNFVFEDFGTLNVSVFVYNYNNYDNTIAIGHRKDLARLVVDIFLNHYFNLVWFTFR